MKMEFKQIRGNLVQYTTTDERWYRETQMDGSVIDWPSVTYIASFYPKGIEYVKWIGNRGFDEAERIKIEAGDRGTVVHKACEQLLKTKSVKHDDKFNDKDGNLRELTGDEYWAVDCFNRWRQRQSEFEILEIEQTVINRTDGYAGTLDLIVKFGDRIGVVDLKTSPNIWPSHELQVSALQKAWEQQNGKGLDFRAILQVGYKRNKDGFKFTEVNDNYQEFLAIKKIWAKETAGAKPLQRDLPLEIK